jgi:hypothetical protein
MAKQKIEMGGRALKLTLYIDDERMTLTLKNVVGRISDFRRYWADYFAPQFFADIQENFMQEGALVGGWRSLSPAYAAWKMRHYGPKPILVRTGALKASLIPKGRNNVLRAYKSRGEFGSSLKYLTAHQRGIGVPRRQVLFFRSTRIFNRLLATWLRDEMNAAGMNARVTA